MPENHPAEKPTPLEIFETLLAKGDRRNAAYVWAEMWGPVVNSVLANPEGPHTCPCCKQQTIRAAWGLYNDNPRQASFDAWCEACGKRFHGAMRLPAHAADSYPPGAKHEVASLTKRIFQRGKKLKWW